MIIRNVSSEGVSIENWNDDIIIPGGESSPDLEQSLLEKFVPVCELVEVAGSNPTDDECLDYNPWIEYFRRGAAGNRVATPVFNPNAGTVSKGATVTITCSTEGATIYYTVDGSTPSSSSTQYTDPVVINSTTTLKAIAVKEEMDDSSVKTATYTVVLPKVATPTFSPAAGTVELGTEVTISCSTEDAEIHYTVDGNTPDSSSPVYSSAITINSTTTVKAIGIKEDYDDSAVATAAYVVNIPTVATPTFSPNPGNVEMGTEVTMACTTDGATIYYTTDGTNPSDSSTKYTGPVTLNSTTTLKAIAIKDGYNNSQVKSGTYTITVPTVATPVITPASGAVASGSKATITCSTDGADIHYTTDGSTPDSSSPVYSSEISITNGMTIKAIGIKANYNNSSVASASYTIALPYYAGIYNNPDEDTDVIPEFTQSLLENLVDLDTGIATVKAYPATGTSEHSFDGIDQDNLGRVVYAYPKSLGLLTKYVQNGMEQNIGNTFSTREITIDGNEYIIYVMTDGSGSNPLPYRFF